MAEPALREAQPLAPVTAPVSEATAIVSMLERAARDPAVDVDKIMRLYELHEKATARAAEVAYADALSSAQAELGPVATDAHNPQTKSRYATYGALDRAVRPIYVRHGFALSFGTSDSPLADHLRVTCRVTHRAGHAEVVHVDMPADGKGAKGGDVMTKTHAAGAAMSYGQRYLLKLIFNIAVGEDADGNAPAARLGDGAQRQVEKINACATLEQLEAWRSANRDAVKALPAGEAQRVTQLYGQRLHHLREPA